MTKVFLNPCTAALYQHKLKHKERSTEFPCSYCGKKFPLQCNLNAHVKLCHHLDPKTCEICGKVFDNPERLKSHHYNVHSGVVHKKYTPKKDKSDWACPICGKVVAACSKRSHLQTHEEPKYTCDICGKKIKEKKTFEQHMNIHMNILDHRCEPCNKVILLI